MNPTGDQFLAISWQISLWRHYFKVWLHAGILTSSCYWPGITLASSWYHPGIILVSSWHHPGVILISCWYHPAIILVSSWYRSVTILVSYWHNPRLSIFELYRSCCFFIGVSVPTRGSRGDPKIHVFGFMLAFGPRWPPDPSKRVSGTDFVHNLMDFALMLYPTWFIF